jgi:hypothetical protein
LPNADANQAVERMPWNVLFLPNSETFSQSNRSNPQGNLSKLLMQWVFGQSLSSRTCCLQDRRDMYGNRRVPRVKV